MVHACAWVYITYDTRTRVVGIEPIKVILEPYCVVYAVEKTVTIDVTTLAHSVERPAKREAYIHVMGTLDGDKTVTHLVSEPS